MHAKLVDAHVHLTDGDFAGLSARIIDMLRSLDIKAVSVSMDMETSRKNLELAGSNSDVVIPFIGIHPWAAGGESLDDFSRFLESNASSVAGIGEIGLDRKYVSGSINEEDGYRRQRQVFESMLALAEKLGKPTSIHSRGSLDDVLSALGSYKLKGVLLHWFAGSKKQLRRANEMGCYVSYGPVLVYSKDMRSLLKDTSTELVLVETDGPVRYGSCFENMVALPSFLPSVALTLARTLRMDYDGACGILVRNSTRYLGLAGNSAP
ncbi:MAG: TatD family hydrolase [Nitrososphaerales archaeon]